MKSAGVPSVQWDEDMSAVAWMRRGLENKGLPFGTNFHIGIRTGNLEKKMH